jgi:tetratricopeptide (TPR) repeat protein
MSAPSPAQARELPTEGRFAERPLPRVLLELHARRFDGRLVLRSGRQEKRFTFERGAPVLLESNVPSEALCALLMARGLIDAAAQGRIETYVRQKACRESVAVLALRLVGPKDLFLALKEQIRRGWIDSFGWPEGHFGIEPGEARGEDAQALRCDPLVLTQEGLEAHWRIERMLGDLAGPLDRYATPRKRFAKLAQRLRLAPDQAARLAGLDGGRPLGVALGPMLGTPRTVAAIWILDALQAFDYHDAPVANEDDAHTRFESEIEIELDGARPAPEAPRRGPQRAAAAPAQQGGRAPGEADDLRAQIEKLRAALGEIDHYQVLGLERDVRPAAIKKAYIKAAKQYHPDTLARLGLEDLRQDASEVFARIGEAFEVLSDPDRRKDYDAELRGELTGKDMARLAQAEKSYRKGEILLRMGDFAGALEYLRPAVETWPDEPVYQSALGWALFKQPQSDPEAARTHLTEAIRMGPEDATAHMRLGMVLRALGEHAEAEKITAIAKRLNPERA